MTNKRVTNKPRQPVSIGDHAPVTDDTRTQSERFVDKARELGCDEDEDVFRDKLRVIARQKPSVKPTGKKRELE